LDWFVSQGMIEKVFVKPNKIPRLISTDPRSLSTALPKKEAGKKQTKTTMKEQTQRTDPYRTGALRIKLINYEPYQTLQNYFDSRKNRPKEQTPTEELEQTSEGAQEQSKNRARTGQEQTSPRKPATIKGFDPPKNVKNLKNINEGRGRVKNSPDPGVKDFLNWFSQEVERATGASYLISHGKDENLIKKMLALHGPEKLRAFAQDFLRDNQGKREGFTVGVFYRALNRLAQSHRENPLEEARRHQREREARNGKSN